MKLSEINVNAGDVHNSGISPGSSKQHRAAFNC